MIEKILTHLGLQARAPELNRSHGGQLRLRGRRFRCATNADGLRRHLFDHHRIEVPVTQHGPHTFVRVSVQAYNAQAELDELLAALAEAGV